MLLRTTVTRMLFAPIAAAVSLALVFGMSTPASAVTTHTISGRVYLGSTSTAAGAGEVTVSFMTSATVVAATATTDSTGYFVSPQLTGNYYIVKFDYAGTGDYGSMFYGNYVAYSLGSGVFTTSDQILQATTLPEMVTITGNISLGELGDHPGGTAAVNWEWNYSYSNWQASGVPDVITAPDGSFTMHLRTGNYQFSVMSQDSDYQSRPINLVYHSNIRLTVTTSTTTFPAVALPPMGHVTGRVVVGSAAVPASAGEYTITAEPCSPTCAKVTTAADGTFALPPLYDANYRVLIYPTADGRLLNDNQKWVNVTVGAAGREVVIPDVSVPKRVTVSGHVTLDDADHPAGAGRVRVMLRSFYRTYTAYTDASGDYEIPGVVQTGMYSAMFSDTQAPIEYADQYFDDRPWSWNGITIGEADPTFNATMHKAASISGRLTDSSGQPLGGLTVTARRFDADREAEILRTTTASDGTYQLFPLPEGDYKVTGEKTTYGGIVYTSRQYGPDYLHPALPGFVHVDTGESLGDVDMTMFRPTSVTIRVRCIPCSTTGFVNGSDVYLLRQGDKRIPDDWSTAAYAATSGEYASFGAVEPGTYRAVILVGGYSTSTTFFTGHFTVKDGDTAPVVVPFSFSQLIRDYNGDFAPDLLSRSYQSGLLLTAGQRTTIGTTRTLISRSAPGSTYFSGGDIDWDGDPDIMEITSSGVLYKLPGSSRGVSGKKITISSGWSKYTWVSEVGDLDFDGNDDFVAKDTAGVLWLIRNTKPSVFAAPKKISSGWNIWSTIIAAGDLNFDGYADLVTRDKAGKVWFVAGDGGTKFASPVETTANWSAYTSFAATGDFDGDGYGDVVATDRAGRVWLLPGDGNGAWLTARVVGTGWLGRTLIP